MEPTLAKSAPPTVGIGWLIRLRWLAAAAQVLGLVLLGASPSDALSPLAYGVPLAVALTNLPARGAADRFGFDRVAASLLALDTLLLTGLLAATGGALNPFTIFYLVEITLSALVLSPAATWWIALLSAAGFGSLFFAGSDSPLAHMRLTMADHLKGMWIAYLSAATATTAFVTALRANLERRERELAEVRAQRDRNERLAALSTLVGGAAHELATPLATIGVIVGELRREGGSGVPPQIAEDLDTVAEELVRCRAILDEMAAGAGESPGERSSEVSAAALLTSAIDRLEPERRPRVSADLHGGEELLHVPPRAVARALEGLLRNAFEASPPNAGVVARIEVEPPVVRFVVEDRGGGLDERSLRHAGEPFFTTKGAGKGLGLGLFVARSLAGQLGGDLTLAPATAVGTGGTVATLTLPLAKTQDR